MNEHAVQFYEDDNFLIEGLSEYIGNAISMGNQGIVIATKKHLARLKEVLNERGLLNEVNAGANGLYTQLEVDEMLPQFMEDGMPNEARFLAALGDVIVRASRNSPGHVYVFGEMVAILCGASECSLHPFGRHTAAIHVERFFNELRKHYSFSLLCGYPLSAFPGKADAPIFREVCDLHSDVLPAESYDPHADVGQLQRSIASLQQQAYSLAAEVHDRMLVEQALREVNFDRLTGLPNRNVFHDRLEIDIKKAHRSGLPLALLFIDLDHFKEINDTLGHDTGDRLLQQVGQRLSSYVRASDTVSRLGGDEFTVTLSELHDLERVTDVAQRILKDLSEPFHLGDEIAYISASIGITFYPQDANNVTDLLRNADQAMYLSKDTGRNCLSFFNKGMQEAARARMSLSNDLRQAISANQLIVFYQPIVDLQTGQIVKAEALVRWRHPLHGLISPDNFIPIAEHTGMIVAIGDWVFHEALKQARRWRDINSHFSVSVNVSPVQFYRNTADTDHEWLRFCHQVSDQTNNPESAVGLEITESVMLASNSSVTKQLVAFQKAGMKISLDDFGTGYSSLSYLRKFDLDFLKIDQSFVFNLENDPANVALCEAIIVMAHRLGLQVIAEGIETKHQRDVLRAAQCDFGQGFLFGHPLPANEFEVLLRGAR